MTIGSEGFNEVQHRHPPPLEAVLAERRKEYEQVIGRYGSVLVKICRTRARPKGARTVIHGGIGVKIHGINVGTSEEFTGIPFATSVIRLSLIHI